MTIQEYRDKMANMASSVDRDIGEIVQIEAERFAGDIKNRVVRTGTGTNGTKLKPYSTKPRYYTKSQFDKKGSFSPRGKNGKAHFGNGKKRRSMYLKHGYKELRSIQGKPTSITNLNYRGQLMLSFGTESLRDEVLIGFSNEEASKKRKDLSSYYEMPIFYGSAKEIKKFSDRLIEEYKIKVNVRDY